MSTPRFPILFITSSRIGDAVLSSGLVRRLLDEVPHARFTIVAGPLAAPMFRETPGLERLIALDKAPGGLHWLSLWRQVRGRRWGLVVDLRGSGLARFLSARRRAVKRRTTSFMEPAHKVVEAARVLHVEDDPPAPYLFTSETVEAAAAALLGQGGPILAMAPAANWAGKTWPSERFAVVAAELLGAGGPMRDGRLLLLGGPDDRFAAEAVRRVIPRARLIDTVGRVDLLTAYACLKQARLFIGNDSGLMHLAAAAGVPTLGLFGPSDDRLYAPWGPKAQVLRGPRDFETFKKIDPELNQVVCHMFDLPTSWVANAARRLFDATAAEYPEPLRLPEPEPPPPQAVEAAPPGDAKTAPALEGAEGAFGLAKPEVVTTGMAPITPKKRVRRPRAAPSEASAVEEADPTAEAPAKPVKAAVPRKRAPRKALATADPTPASVTASGPAPDADPA